MQKAKDICYEIDIPKELTGERAGQHVHAVYIDDEKVAHGSSYISKISYAKRRFEKTACIRAKRERIYGCDLRVPVKKEITRYIKTEAL